MAYLTKKLSMIAVAAAGVLCLASCNKSDKTNETTDDRPVLAVSVAPQQAWLEQIVGDRYRIVTLLPAGANPETYEPSISVRKDLEDAEAYFMVGPLLFESNLRMSMHDTMHFVDTSRGVYPIYGTHVGCRDHRSFLPSEENITPDPHFWTSVENARIMSKNMAEHMAKIDPEHAKEYMENFDNYDQHLDSLNQAYHARLDTASVRSFMVWHPSLSYFARDYNLHQIPVGSESKEVSMQSMRQVINEALDDNVKVFFHQSDYDSRQVSTINGAIGSRLVPINLSAYEWEAQLDSIVNELSL